MSKVQTMLLSGALLSLLSGCIEVGEEEPQTSEPQVIEIEEQEQEEVKEEVKEEEQLVIKMNEPFTVGAYSSETYEHIEEGFEVTLQSVRLSQVFNEYHEEQVENIAIIQLEVKNISGELQYFSVDNFNYYDMDSNVLSPYPTVDTTYSDVVELNPNRKATLEFAIGIPHGTDFEMEVLNNDIDCEPVGSVFFISGELQESEEQSPIERAEDIIDNVGEVLE